MFLCSVVEIFFIIIFLVKTHFFNVVYLLKYLAENYEKQYNELE